MFNIKKAIISSVVMGSLALSANTVVASETQPQAEKLNPWQHCGIGAAVFTENGTAAAISNIIWDLGTTAVSSNISSKDSCSGANAKTAMFIKATMPSLEQDIAAGEGEYLNAMIEMRQCDAGVAAQIKDAVREDFAKNPNQDAEAFYNAFEQRVTSSFAGACASV